MRYEAFIAAGTDRGEYPSPVEAKCATAAVLGLFSQFLTPGESKDLAAQLPAGLADMLADQPGPAATFGVEEFCRRLTAELDDTDQTAR